MCELINCPTLEVLYCVAIGMCELNKCLSLEICCCVTLKCVNLLMSYMGSATIVWLLECVN
jgi:hypothetical protein